MLTVAGCVEGLSLLGGHGGSRFGCVGLALYSAKLALEPLPSGRPAFFGLVEIAVAVTSRATAALTVAGRVSHRTGKSPA
jgi:hypothetical protein